MSKTKRNSFTRKMEAKSTQELREIVNNKDFVKEARVAAKWELETREEDGTLEMENQKRMDSQLDESRYADFVKTIKKKRSFTFFRTPSYAESLENNLSIEAKYGIVMKALKKLKWEIVVTEENQIQAVRPKGTEGYSEQILIGFGPSNLLVKSISLGSESMDFGRNSVRVKLFIHVFLETVDELGEEGIAAAEQEIISARNWEDYEVPEKLPQPPAFKSPKPMLAMAGTVLVSVAIGGVLGFLMNSFYIVFLYEMAAAWLLAHAMASIMIFANHFHWQKTHYLFIFAIFLIILSAQIAGYLDYRGQNPDFRYISFFQYMELKIRAGFYLKNTNLGWIGWIGVFVMQVIVLYTFGLMRLAGKVTGFQINRVPEEVIEFIYYLSAKDHDEKSIRKELAARGWNETYAQEYAFEAIGAIEGQQEMNKEQ